METEEYGDINDDEIIPDSLPEESMADDDGEEEVFEDDIDEGEEGILTGDQYPDDEETPEEESHAEQEHEINKRDRSQTRINQIQREKYQAQYQLQQLGAENERLKQMFDQSASYALSQTELNVQKRLQDAKRAKVEAIEAYDAKAQAEADIELAAATNEMQYLNNWKAEKSIQQQQQQQAQQQQQLQIQQQQQFNPYELNEGSTQNWMDNNAWCDPRSPRFDQDKANDADQYSAWLNQQLYASGEAHAIGGEQYFAALNTRANQYDTYRNSHTRRDLNMKSPRGGASPSRSGHVSQASQGKGRQIITPAEQDMARRMNVTDKVYLQYRIKDQQENGHKRRGGR